MESGDRCCGRTNGDSWHVLQPRARMLCRCLPSLGTCKCGVIRPPTQLSPLAPKAPVSGTRKEGCGTGNCIAHTGWRSSSTRYAPFYILPCPAQVPGVCGVCTDAQGAASQSYRAGLLLRCHVLTPNRLGAHDPAHLPATPACIWHVCRCAPRHAS